MPLLLLCHEKARRHHLIWWIGRASHSLKKSLFLSRPHHSSHIGSATTDCRLELFFGSEATLHQSFLFLPQLPCCSTIDIRRFPPHSIMHYQLPTSEGFFASPLKYANILPFWCPDWIIQAFPSLKESFFIHCGSPFLLFFFVRKALFLLFVLEREKEEEGGLVSPISSSSFHSISNPAVTPLQTSVSHNLPQLFPSLPIILLLHALLHTYATKRGPSDPHQMALLNGYYTDTHTTGGEAYFIAWISWNKRENSLNSMAPCMPLFLFPMLQYTYMPVSFASYGPRVVVLQRE